MPEMRRTRTNEEPNVPFIMNRVDTTSLLDQSVLQELRVFLSSLQGSKAEINLRYRAELYINPVTNQNSVSLTRGTTVFSIIKPQKRAYNFETTQLRYVRLTNPDVSDHCVICFSKIKSQEVIANCRCTHIFHSNCLQNWLSYKNHCPICRKNLFC